jgi:hypothetical protein
LRAQIVAKDNNIYRSADRLKEAIKVSHMNFHKDIEKSMCPLWFAGQHHEEVVHAVIKLAPSPAGSHQKVQ